MEFIKVTKENLGKEHICCAISNNKDIQHGSQIGSTMGLCF